MRWLLTFLICAGCSPKGYIFVQVSSKSQLHDVASLRGSVTHDGRTRPFELPHKTPVDIPPDQSFAIEVPPEVIGILQLHLEAVDSMGNVLAVGDVSGLVSDGRLLLTFGETADGGVHDLSSTGADGGPHDLAAPVGDLGPRDLLGLPPCPNIMVMVDYTGSMGDLVPDAGMSKFAAEVAAVNTVVGEFQNRVPIGLTTFAETTACSLGVTVGPEPQGGSGPAIATRLSQLTASGNSGNNDVALHQIGVDPLFLQRHPSYIIMITDNAPNCLGLPREVEAAGDAAASLFSSGYPVYVVGLNPVMDTVGLSKIALSGGVPCVGSCGDGGAYFEVGDQISLADRLRAIFNQVAGACAN